MDANMEPPIHAANFLCEHNRPNREGNVAQRATHEVRDAHAKNDEDESQKLSEKKLEVKHKVKEEEWRRRRKRMAKKKNNEGDVTLVIIGDTINSGPQKAGRHGGAPT